MSAPTQIKSFCLSAAAFSLIASPMASAAVIDQTVNSSASLAWNDALWGTPASAPTTGNDYVGIASGLSPTTIYTINGLQWIQDTWSVQDTRSNLTDASVSGAFAGDSLIMNTNSAINAKATGGSTQTVNIVFNGGFYRGNYVGGAADPSSTLAGTIEFATPTTVAAVGGYSPNNSVYAFTLNSTITGGSDNVLQLTMNGGTARTVFYTVNGDLSGFFGTIYAGVSTSGAAVGVSGNSLFSITSDAVNATLQLDHTTTNFHYLLDGDITVGALSLGAGEGSPLGVGVYDTDSLNTLAAGDFFFGDGTITVVPEPGTIALLALGGAMALFVLPRRLRRRKS